MTSEDLSKKQFLEILNDVEWSSPNRQFYYKHSLGRLSFSMGFEFVDSKRLELKDGVFRKKIIDITNYSENTLIFNSLRVLIPKGNELFLVKDNFNEYRIRVGLDPLSPYFFKKLSDFTGYPLIKKFS